MLSAAHRQSQAEQGARDRVHRAAIGLTEENDSLAIVVSEETGRISLVADGQIERSLDPDALRVRLRALISQAGARRSPVSSRVQYTS